MCRSVAEGGQRCAAHTRPEYQAALRTLAAVTGSAREDVRVSSTSAVREHAATRTGHREVSREARAAAHRGDQETAAWLATALREGSAQRAAAREAVMGTRPAGVAGFTEADRQPQDPDQKFGISDHVTRVPPTVLVRYRDKDASARPRDHARMAALRADVAEHGIGNPLVLFHDGKRATLAEGNHRLAIALEQEMSEVPVRVIRLRSLNEVSTFAKTSKPIDADLRAFLRPA